MGERGRAAAIILLIVVVTVLVDFYLISGSEIVKRISLWGIVLVIALAGGLVLWRLFHRAGKMRRKLQEIEPLLEEETAEQLEKKYLEIYSVYLKLSEKGKQNFYARLAEMKEVIEGKMRLEKQMEILLKEAEEGSPKERKKKGQEISELYGKMPPRVQERFREQASLYLG